MIVTVVVAIAIYYHLPDAAVRDDHRVRLCHLQHPRTAHLSPRDKALLSMMAPVMYVLLRYILSVVEYIALLQSIMRLPRLRESISGEQVTWTSPERSCELEGRRHRAELVAAR